ncbi:MAG: class I SAM-dependent methyltransferase [Gemmatimonadota bacterium]|nr:class I SAM-dependent methyltransferase [Candidatus Palauibacterales bacterium]
MLSKLLRRSVKRLVEGEKEYRRLQAAMTDLIIRASGGKPPESLLDVGCGEGGYTRQNAEALGLALDRVHGVDFNPSHLEAAEENFSIARVDLERDRLPFPNDEFELVVCNQVLEHIKNIFWLLAEMDRVTQPGGSLLIGVPNLTSLLNRPFLMLGRQPVTVGIEGPHVRAFTFHGLSEFFAGHPGYRIETALGSSLYPWPAKLGAEALARRLPSLSAYFFVSLRKLRSVDPCPWLAYGIDGETSFVHWEQSLRGAS